MAVESNREKLIYFGLVPILAAIAGAVIAAWFQASACAPVSADSFTAILTHEKMTGAEKLKALEIYKVISDRPWAVVRNLVTFLFVALGALGGAIATRIMGR